ncbi:response regulator transcription factor [Paraglaciecola aquimarina]|uniref:Response regulator transcription factor n=1 Tax=Paraglaciecola algarum TaxID=3050085 RepID=A0ABS9D5L5_9ALTE|nr:response regulator transcription factor [Paraglaciecola sp. G1-23]MCF2947715.1 response regulator transcription factor [Paraglaciecola sp. G1-23]
MSENKHILIVEDEIKIASLIGKYLTLHEYVSSHVSNGIEALNSVKNHMPDLIILDVMLPKLDGLAVCKTLRKFTNVPIIFLTARIEEVDHLIGFDLGADDYVTKPFRPLELMARVKAVLSRSDYKKTENVLVVGSVSLNVDKHLVTVNEQSIKLTVNEFNLLKAFLEYPNKVFSREELLTAIQGKYSENYERAIDSHIKNLRKKLSVELDIPSRIESIYGVGYKYLAG